MGPMKNPGQKTVRYCGDCGASQVIGGSVKLRICGCGGAIFSPDRKVEWRPFDQMTTSDQGFLRSLRINPK